MDALNRLLAEFGYPQRYDHDAVPGYFGFPIEEYYVRAGLNFKRHSFAELAAQYMENYFPPVPRPARCETARLTRWRHFAALGCGRSFYRPAIWTPSAASGRDERGVTRYFDRLLGLGDIYAKSKVEIGLAI